jgi:ACS family glucarate transporter-like MFS transporter
METVRVMPTQIHGLRIRWRIFGMLVAAGAVVYFQQRAISIAAERIMPELHLSQMQIGWLQWAFVLSYGLLQMPGGVVGQRIGARRALTGLLLIAVAACVAAPLAPYVLQGTPLFIALFLSQLLLGMAHAPFFPVCAGTMEAWLPANRWALAQGLHTFGCQAGAAIAPLVFVLLIASLGWQPALIWASLPPLALIAIWAWYGRDSPREHPSVSAEEIAELEAVPVAPIDTQITRARVWAIMRDRSVAAATLSYISMNYVFYLLSTWSFLYLIQERHFAVIEGGALATLPPIGAAIGAGAGGSITDALCRRFGVRWGFRLVPLVSLPLAGILLLLATGTSHAYVAVGALTLAYTAVEINEASYWAGTMRIAQADTMAATGILNTGGNAGGWIGIPIVAYLSGQGHWQATFLIGFACALAAALAWLWVDAGKPLVLQSQVAV